MDLSFIALLLCVLGVVVSWLYEMVGVHNNSYAVPEKFNRKLPMSSVTRHLLGIKTFCGLFWAVGVGYGVLYWALFLVIMMVFGSIVGWVYLLGGSYVPEVPYLALAVVEALVLICVVAVITLKLFWKGLTHTLPKLVEVLPEPSSPKFVASLKEMYRDHKDKYCKILRSDDV